MKIYVSNEDHTIKVQNVLFDNGYKWHLDTHNIPFLTPIGSWVFTDENGIMTWDEKGNGSIAEYKLMQLSDHKGIFHSFVEVPKCKLPK